MIINKKVTKSNELKVLGLLEDVLGGRWELAKDKYSCYDIAGLDRDANRTLVEVKLRTKLYPKLWIEFDKVLAICNKFKQKNADKAILVCGIDDKQYLYDLKRIITYPLKEREMNYKTSSDFKGSGNKTTKKVYEFPWDDFMIELTTQELGHNYEVNR